MKVQISFNAVLDHKEDLDRIRKKCDELIEVLQQINEQISNEDIDLARHFQQNIINPIYTIRDQTKSKKVLLDDIVSELKKTKRFMDETVDEIGEIVKRQTGQI